MWIAEYISPKAPFPIFFNGMYLLAMRNSCGVGLVDEAAVLDIISQENLTRSCEGLTAPNAFELFFIYVD